MKITGNKKSKTDYEKLQDERVFQSTRSIQFNNPVDRAPRKVQKKTTGEAGKINRKSLIIFAFFFITVAAAFGLTTYYIVQYNRAVSAAADISNLKSISDEKNAIIDKIKKIVLIHDDEDFTFKTIQDAGALKKTNPDLYADAKNGALQIVSSRRVIIYDNDKNLIVNMVTTNVESVSTPTISPSATSVPVTPIPKK